MISVNPKGCDVLNDCLHTGPKFNQRILEVLLRFQSYPVFFLLVIMRMHF